MLLAAEDEACLARFLVHQGPLRRLKANLLTCLVETSRISKEHSAPVRAKAVRALGSVIEADTRLLAVHTVVQGASSALQVGRLHMVNLLADRVPKLGMLLDMRTWTSGDGHSSMWCRRPDPMLHAAHLPCTCAAVIPALTSARRACSACASISSCCIACRGEAQPFPIPCPTKHITCPSLTAVPDHCRMRLSL